MILHPIKLKIDLLYKEIKGEIVVIETNNSQLLYNQPFNGICFPTKYIRLRRAIITSEKSEAFAVYLSLVINYFFHK